jgi:hypothetical protein
MRLRDLMLQPVPSARHIFGTTIHLHRLHLLTLIVIPAFYEIMDEWREKLLHSIDRRRGVEGRVSHAPQGEPGMRAPLQPALSEPTP